MDRELGAESGSSTRLVDQLEAKGLLVRKRSVTDQRVVGITLTASGREFVTAMQPRLIRFWELQLSIFTSAERHTLFELLSRLRDGLVGDIPGDGDASCSDAA